MKMTTVEQLIEKLKKLDPNKPVQLYIGTIDYGDFGTEWKYARPISTYDDCGEICVEDYEDRVKISNEDYEKYYIDD